MVTGMGVVIGTSVNELEVFIEHIPRAEHQVKRFQFFAVDRQTDDKTDCLTPLRACARGVIMYRPMPIKQRTSGVSAFDRFAVPEFSRHAY